MKKVKDYIEKYQMIKTGDRVIAGVSGGADSVCLLFVLLELQKEVDFSLTAVHVNHGLRGDAADADEAFVKKLCEMHEVPLEIFRVDLELIAGKRKQSLEEAGREIRREAFEEVLNTTHADRIALAHHQNDNAETLLWNLVRGTGLTGLGGIRPVNGVFIRPLLCLDRQEIEAYLELRGQTYCTDQTNLETEYTRNKLRHQVIPVLEEEVNEKAVRHMNETMEQMQMLQEFVEQKTLEAADTCLDFEETEEYVSIRIAEKEWSVLPEFLKGEVICHCMERLTGTRKNLGKIHVDAVKELFEKQTGKERDLIRGIRAVREYDGVILEKRRTKKTDLTDLRKSKDKEEEAVFLKKQLQIPGEIYVPEINLHIKCRIIEKKDDFNMADIPQKEYTKWFDYDIIKTCLHIRTRETGDSIVIDRAGHRQKLKSWFVNEKIPAKERARIPLLADGDRIVWIIGHRMSSACQVSAKTKRILQIEIE